ncbi:MULTISPECIES: GNAT family N-acetyltransferase [Halomonadaceae]|jgi:putative acetyltransferase|uniref:GNAT family N-acetyltransferase n=1 Tax=Vreelandella piezotolerans TaxID=2609667 RepID=A0ABQ6XBF2_9GAMM|nr:MULTISPECIES: GNAT family N-acetyltransferase [Halomonas]KAE8439320.1 GNAT family N-acetyltransferase [Halomonas piezotolerans]MCG7591146.1 GNAT family N-acetyltransferase [Halomonas sp. McD50-5]MCG7617190.1 GNAT family N-acetyltransferase [Halomonas sp. McD50-4]QJA25161.1 GNAT family N-acetyltransferase [Halomonas piezotolerans]TNH17543.1 GNAT family N-acetyltransferase [Halomonas sp. BL6]
MLKTNERAPSAAPTARVTYRAALAKDAADQAEVFYHAVMQGAATHYGLDERRAWANALPREASAWAARQALYTTLVAACDGRCVGFLELNISAGRIETLYVWPSLAGRGIGTTLLIHAERILLENGVSSIEIEASLVLYERLLRRGFDNLGEQWVERSGEMLRRYRLVKRLSAIET